MPFLSASRITGTISPFGVSAAKPTCTYCFSTSWSPSSEALRELLQRGDAGLDQEGEHRDLDARLLVLLVQLHAERFELGDVGIVMVGDVRDHHPVAVQVGAADLLDAREVLALDRAELGEVDLRPRQQAGEARATCSARSRTATGRGLRRLRLGLLAAGHHGLHEGLHVVLRDAALGSAALHFFQRHAEFAGELADAGGGVREVGLQHRRLVGGNIRSHRTTVRSP
jgi:hypothetical protein